MSKSRKRTGLLLTLFVCACAKIGPVQEQHALVIRKLEQAEADPWSRVCAPREMARAQANKEFAELEFQQASPFRAEDYLKEAWDNVAQVAPLTDACRPQDKDGDGLMDHLDACPELPETVNNYRDEDGCPEQDRDGDGLFDELDKCPEEAEDKDDFEDDDGCPENDNDNDGIVDTADKCRNTPEDYDGYQDEDGCPEETADSDGDGIFDDVDRCINQPETRNNYLDEDGCPDDSPKLVRVTKTAIIIEDKIYFEYGKAVIMEKSFGILNSVAQVMKDYDQIKVSVDGHTDSDGSDRFNLKLSKRRAASVRNYLIEQGIGSSRLVSKGYGESSPIADNLTAEGKEKNRRVEFNILSGMD